MLQVAPAAVLGVAAAAVATAAPVAGAMPGAVAVGRAARAAAAAAAYPGVAGLTGGPRACTMAAAVGSRRRAGQRTGGTRVVFVLPGGAGVDAGIGCGDRLMALPVPVAEGGDPLRTAIEALLSSGQRLAERAGLYNAFGRSRLRIEELRVQAGVVTLRLAGELRLGGACDAPRVRAQLEGTVLHFPGLRELRVTVNGVPLAELLSGR